MAKVHREGSALQVRQEIPIPAVAAVAVADIPEQNLPTGVTAEAAL